MSENGGAVDKRIVQMEFQNEQFEKGVKDSIRSLEDLKKALKIEDTASSLKNIEDGLASVRQEVQRTSETMASLERLGEKAFSPIERFIQRTKDSLIEWPANQIVSAFNNAFIKPLRDGMDEYEEKMSKVQTLTNAIKWNEFDGNGVAAMNAVNASLDRLNTYADKTIYSFKDMTTAFAKFVQQSDLTTAEESIKGLYNAAAYFGLNKQQGSMVSYNMAQALGQGKMDLMNWRSFELATMGGRDSIETIIKVAKALGRLNEAGGIVGATSKAAKKIQVTRDTFRASLQHGWMDNDVMTAWMQLYSGTLPKKVADNLEMMGVPVQQIAEDAKLAATEIKSFGQLFDTIGEALGTGWGATFEVMFGDLNTIKERLTAVGQAVQDVIDRSSKNRTWALSRWLNEGNAGIYKGYIVDPENPDASFDHPGVEKITEAFKNLSEVITNVYNAYSNFKNAFNWGLNEGAGGTKNDLLANLLGFTPDAIAKATKKLADFSKDLSDFFSPAQGFYQLSKDPEKNKGKLFNNSFYDIQQMAKPLGAALAIVADAGSAVFNVFGQLLGVITPLPEGLLHIVSSLTVGLFPALDGLRKSKVFTTFAENLKQITGPLKTFTTTISKWMFALGDGIKAALGSEIFQTIVSAIPQALGWIVNLVGKLVTWLGGGLVSTLNGIFSVVSTIWNVVSDLFSKGFDWLMNFLKSNSIIETFTKSWERLKGFGKSIWETLFPPKKEGQKTAWDTTNEKIKTLKDNLLKSDAFKSFSKEFSESLNKITAKLPGLVDKIISWLPTIQKGIGFIKGTLKGVFAIVLGVGMVAFKGLIAALKTVWNLGKKVFTKVKDWAKNFWETSKASEKLSKVWKKIKGYGKNIRDALFPKAKEGESVWDSVLAKAKEIKTKIVGSQLFQKLKAGVNSFIDKLPDNLTKFETKLTSAFTKIKGVFSKLKNSVVGWFKNKINTPGSPLKTLWDSVKSLFEPVEGENEMSLSEYIAAQWHKFDPVFDVMKQGFRDTLTKFYTWTGEDNPEAKTEETIASIKGVIEKLKSGFSTIAEAVESFFEPVEGVNPETGENYTFLEELGVRIERLTPALEVIKKGIRQILTSALSGLGVEDADKTADTMIQTVTDTIEKIKGKFSTVVSILGTLFDPIEDVDNKTFGEILDIQLERLSPLVEGARNTFVEILDSVLGIFEIPEDMVTGEEIVQAVEKFFSGATELFNRITGVVGNFITPTQEGQNVFDVMKEKFKDIPTTIRSLGGLILDILNALIDTFIPAASAEGSGGAEQAATEVATKTEELGQNMEIVKASFTGFATQVQEVGQVVSENQEATISGMTSVSDFIGAIKGKMVEIMNYFTSDNFKISDFTDRILEIGGALGGISVAFGAGGALRGIGKAGKGIKELTESISDIPNLLSGGKWLKTMEKIQKKKYSSTAAQNIEAFGDSFLKFGLGLLSIVGAVTLLTTVVGQLKNVDDFKESLLILAGALAAFTASEFFTGMSHQSGNGTAYFLKMALGLVGVVGAIKFLIDVLGTTSEEQMTSALTILGGVLATFTASEFFTGMSGQTGNGAKNFFKIGLGLKMAIWALSDIINLVKANDGDENRIADSLNVFTYVLGLLTASDGLLSKFGGTNTAHIKSFVAIAIGLKIAIWAINDIANSLKTDEDSARFKQALIAFFGVLAAVDFTVLLDTIKNKLGGANSNTFNSLISFLGFLGGAVMAIWALAAIFDTYGEDNLEPMMKALGGMLAVFAGELVLTKITNTGDLKSALQAITAIGTLAGALLVVVGSLWLLKEVGITKEDAIAMGTAFAEIFGSLGLALPALTKGGWVGGAKAAVNLLEFVVVLAAVGFALDALFKAFPEVKEGAMKGLQTVGDLLHTLFSSIFGNASMGNFADELDKLRDALNMFAEKMKGLDSEALQVGVGALKDLALAAAKIPNEGGLIAWFVGDNSLGKFAENMEDLGKGLKELHDVVKTNNLSTDTFSTVSEILRYFSGIDYSDGTNTAFTASSEMVALAQNISYAAGAIHGTDDADIEKLKNAFGAYQTLLRLMMDGNTLGKDLTQEGFIFKESKFEKNAESISEALSKFVKNESLFSELGRMSGEFINGLAETTKVDSPEILNAASNLTKAFTAHFDTDPSFYNSGVNLAFGLIKGISDCTDVAAGVAQVFAQRMIEQINLALAIKSPSKEAEETASNWMGDYLKDFTDKTGQELPDGIKTLVDNTEGYMKDAEGLIDPNEFAKTIFGEGFGNVDTSQLFNFDMGPFDPSMYTQYLTGGTGTNPFANLFSATDNQNAGKEDVQNYAEGVQNESTTAQSSAQTVADAVAEPIKSVVGQSYEWGANITQGLANGLADATAMGVLNANSQMIASTVKNNISGKPGFVIKSPSHLTYDYGMYIVMGLANGLSDYAYLAGNASAKVTATAEENFVSSLSDYSALLASDLNPTPVIRPVLDLSQIRAQAGMVGSMFDTVPLDTRVSRDNPLIDMLSREREEPSRVNPEIYSAVLRLEDKISMLGERIAGMQVSIDGSALVGSIATRMDKTLSNRATLAGRGN